MIYGFRPMRERLTECRSQDIRQSIIMKHLILFLSLVSVAFSQYPTTNPKYPNCEAYLFQAGGTSMLPTLPLNCWIRATKIPYYLLKTGMIVTRRNRDGTYTTHRLMYKTVDGEWIMQGDNNDSPDAQRLTRYNYMGITEVAGAK